MRQLLTLIALLSSSSDRVTMADIDTVFALLFNDVAKFIIDIVI